MRITLFEIEKFIENYDFLNYFENDHTRFKKDEIERWGIDIIDDDTYQKIANEFWENPQINHRYLMEKHLVRKRVPLYRIIQSYPTQKYIEFLKDYWNYKITVNEIINTFRINYDDMLQIAFPLLFNNPEYICPSCKRNGFFLLLQSVDDIKRRKYNFVCNNCRSNNSGETLLSSYDLPKNKESELKTNKNELRYSPEVLEIYERQLNGKKCPKCGVGSVSIVQNSKKLEVICNHCTKGKWEHYNLFSKEYSNWAELSKIALPIQKNEKRSLNSAVTLKKSVNNLIIKSQNIIVKEECIEALRLPTRNRLDFYKNRTEILSRIKLSTQAELITLNKLIDLCILYGKKINLGYRVGNHTFSYQFIRYTAKDAIIYELLENTKFKDIRSILRRLGARGLIVFCEKRNCVDILPLIIENKGIIDNVLVPQNLEEKLIYKVCDRHGFRCTSCGAVGVKLNIAFLRNDKDISDLSSMIPMCLSCFEHSTENEIVIDGCLAIFGNKSLLKAWDFITNYIPKWEDDNEVFKRCYMLALVYGEIKLIKAFAIALTGIKDGRNKFTNINVFFKYIEKVIEKFGDNYSIPDNMNKEFGINEWLKSLAPNF